MRIADHAPALQNSQALQQPAIATQHQQVLAGEIANAAVARENEKRNTEVNDSEKTENPTIRGEQRKRNRRGRGKAVEGEENNPTSTKAACKKPPSEPGNGNLLDVTV